MEQIIYGRRDIVFDDLPASFEEGAGELVRARGLIRRHRSYRVLDLLL